MMKKIALSFILLFAIAVPMLMADAICDDLMREGIQKYNAGQYEKAKNLFQTVIEQCGADYSGAQQWVTSCCQKLQQPFIFSMGDVDLRVPADFVIREDYGSCVIFYNSDRSIELTVHKLIVIHSLYDEYNELASGYDKQITYKKLGNNWAVVSYFKGDYGYYHRVDVMNGINERWDLKWNKYTAHARTKQMLDNGEIKFIK